MKKHIIFLCGIFLLAACAKAPKYNSILQPSLLGVVKDSTSADILQYHHIRFDQNTGGIIPWYSNNLGQSYDTCLMLVWNFWKNMETDANGLKYYMNRQVWKPESDGRGIGGDQVSMALSSWALLYAYTGDSSIVENMRYMADEFLARSLSDSSAKLPYLPYPYNTDLLSGKYDGDMILGKGFTQPDKAGSFGHELINLYKITADRKYLDAAQKISVTLANNIRVGDNDNSPWPFKVNAQTGEVGWLYTWPEHKKVKPSEYTTNYSGTLELFTAMSQFDSANKAIYQQAFENCLNWMKEYPLKTNKWGPFFEDVTGWSDTQINAITFARYILLHREEFPNWKTEVKGIIEWVHNELGNKEQIKYGVTVTNEQTAYKVPGNSHSSRQAALELMYSKLTGDTSYNTNAVRQLNWATYMVKENGWNRYVRDDIWMTDGYGDFVRHYLRAMAEFPELAPDNKNRNLSSTSVVKHIQYLPATIEYQTYDSVSTEVFRLIRKPTRIFVDNHALKKISDKIKLGYTWQSMDKGGVLTINKKGSKVNLIL
jgi:hypothetical protein